MQPITTSSESEDPYHSNYPAQRRLNPFEPPLDGSIDDRALLQRLTSQASRQQALNYIDQNIKKTLNNLDPSLLFDKLHHVICDTRNAPLQIQGTMLVAKLLPQLGDQVDQCMKKVLSRVVGNIGCVTSVKLQRESIQTLHEYMKHTDRFHYVIHSLAYDGLRHRDKQVRHQVVVTFPALLFPEYKHKDFFDIVHTLVLNLDESQVDQTALRKAWTLVRDYIGPRAFQGCLDRLPNPLRVLLKRHKLVDHLDNQPVPDDQLWQSSESVGLSSRPQSLRHRNSESTNLTIGFVPKILIEKLADSEVEGRIRALDQLKVVIDEIEDIGQLRAGLNPLVSILQPVVSDKNVQVVFAALDIILSTIKKVGFKLTNAMEMFVSTVLVQIGSTCPRVRGHCMKICFEMMSICGPQKLIEQLWRKFSLVRIHSREELVNVITAIILQSNNPKSIDMSKLCLRLSKLLLDKNPNVRLATFECLAVVGNILGDSPDDLAPITNAINQLEMKHESASGVMSAVNARLLRKQLPTLSKQLCIEYAPLPTFLANHSADMKWVHSAGVVKQRFVEGGRGGIVGGPSVAPMSAGVPSKHPSIDRNNIETVKKYSGKQPLFPWADDVSKHPNSAPIQAFRVNSLKELPPVNLRSNWESENDLNLTSTPPRKKSIIPTSFMTSSQSKQDFDLSYRELYLKKNPQKTPQLKSALNGSSYKPSFADAVTSSPATSSTTTDVTKPLFSNSCPSSFFEKTQMTSSTPKNFPPTPSSGGKYVNDDVINADQSAVSLMTKPTLARSASKNRGNPETNKRNQIRKSKINKSIEVSGDVMTSSTSLKVNEKSASTSSLFFDKTLFFDDVKNDDVTASYTPSAVQKMTSSVPTSSFESGVGRLAKVNQQSTRHHPLGNNDVITKSHPIVESKLMPSHHRHPHPRLSNSPLAFDKEIPDHSQMTSIRRSAQDKRQRMLKSQPTSNDILQFASSPKNDLRTANSAQSSFRSPNQRSGNDDVTIDSTIVGLNKMTIKKSSSTDLEAKKINNDVAVVGVRMDYNSVTNNENKNNKFISKSESNRFAFLNESKITNSNTNMTSSTAIKSDSSINVQGKGVFFSPQKKISANDVITSANDDLYQTWSPKRDSLTNRKKLNKSSGESPGNFLQSKQIGESRNFSSLQHDKNQPIEGADNVIDQPERSLTQALVAIETADSESWESVSRSMQVIQKIANNHSYVITSRFSHVIRLLSKQVSNLRSQVSRTSVVTITSIYSNLKKPTVDIDLEVCVAALISEFGKTNVFMREEISKAFNAILTSSTSNRFLQSLLNTGVRHKNKDARTVTANYVSRLVAKIGIEKIFNRDEILEKVLEATAAFITDGSPDVRYHGRCIINDVMTHSRFSEVVEATLTSSQAKEVKKCAIGIQERGLRSSQNSASKRASLHRQLPAPQSAQSNQEIEGLKEILSRLSKGDIQSKREAVDDLFDKILRKHQNLSDDVIKKIMDVFIALLTTSNTKANHLSLQNMRHLVERFGEKMKDSLQLLLPALLKLTVSKNSQLAKQTLDVVVTHVDNSFLLQPFANQATYANGKSRQYALEKLTEIIVSVPPRVVERHAFPVLWNALLTSSSTVYLRKEVTSLAETLYNICGQRLLDVAESKNLLSTTKQFLQQVT